MAPRAHYDITVTDGGGNVLAERASLSLTDAVAFVRDALRLLEPDSAVVVVARRTS